MATTSDVRKGSAIEIGGKVYFIVEYQHVKPGKGNAFVRMRLKNIETGQVIDTTLKSGSGVNVVRVEKRQVQYLYSDEEYSYFMDVQSYDQYQISNKTIEIEKKFLLENSELIGLFADGKFVGIELPFFVILKIIETEPGVKGNTVQGGTKPAVVETGAKINVPLFVNKGDKIKVDTRTGEYVERA